MTVAPLSERSVRPESGPTVASFEPVRLAAVDVGTNSIRLIVAEARPDGSYRLLDDEKEVTRLGAGLTRSGLMSAKAMEASAVAIARMKQIAAGYGVAELCAVATCAVREAGNRDAFVELVKSKARIDLDVISAEEEGRLAFMSVAYAFDLRGMTAAVADIGGGSTELVLSSGGVIQHIHALPLGAVRLTEAFADDGEFSERRFEEMVDFIRRMVRDHVPRPDAQPQVVFGTGGTFTALAAVSQAGGGGGGAGGGGGGGAGGRQRGAERDIMSVRGYELKRAEVNHLLNWLRSMAPKARSRVPGLSAERAEIIVAGVAIIDAVMRRLRVNALRVHDRGIRDGLVLNIIRRRREDELGEAAPPHAPLTPPMPPDRLAAVRRFAQSCNYERAHSEHVAALALRAFDQLGAALPGDGAFTAENRVLLEAAGVLHDVGYAINYAKHHKHSYHLIVHADLPGFTHREIEVIANVARYHRRASPKRKHANFDALLSEDQKIVVKLSAILRVVDGLDRAHAQLARDVDVQVRDGTAWFVVSAEHEPAVDIWGAARKSQLFVKAFDLEPRFEWAETREVTSDE